MSRWDPAKEQCMGWFHIAVTVATRSASGVVDSCDVDGFGEEE